MHVVVLGAGAVGGYFGGKLAQSGLPVTFLVREQRYRQLQEHGLQIQSTYGNFTVHPNLAISPDDIEHPEVVIVAVKNYHLPASFPQLRTLVNKGAKVLPLLNGVEHMDLLIAEFGKENVLGGSCYIETTLDEHGRIVHTSPMQDIVFGALGHVPDEWLQKLEKTLSDCGLRVKLSSHVMQDMWKKFTFLVSFSGITAATRSPIGTVLSDDITSQFLKSLIQEVLEVAELKGIGLSTEETFEQMLTRLNKTPPAMTSSLHRDLEKGLPLEVQSLQGAVVRFAEELQHPVPAMQAVYALLHPFANGNPERK